MPESGLPLVYRVRALRRMVERSIREEDVADVISAGKEIERYPKGQPYPSCLLLGWVEGVPLMLSVQRQSMK